MGVNRLRSTLPVLFLVFVSLASAAPKLRLSTTAYGPVATGLGVNGQSIDIDAVNAGDGTLQLTASSNATWLVPTVVGQRQCGIIGNNQCTRISLALNTAALGRGTYTGIVTLSDPNAQDAPQNVSVTVQVGGGLPETLEYIVAPGGAAAGTSFTSNKILNTAVATQSGGNWLAVAAPSGGSFQFPVTYRINATPLATLTEGTYTGSVTIAGSDLAGMNRAVPVTMRVTTKPIVASTAQSILFRLSSESAAQTYPVAITNAGRGDLAISGVTATAENSGSWLSVTANGGVLTIAANPAGLQPGSYRGTIAVASNAENADYRIPVELQVLAPAPPYAYGQAAVNNATFERGDAVAPGDIVALFGEQLTKALPMLASEVPLATTLNGVRVLVNDTPAPLFYVAHNQINFQLPYEIAPGQEARIRVERDGTVGNTILAEVVPAAPRILRYGEYGVIQNASRNNILVVPPTPGVGDRARPGDVLVVYAIGLGQTGPAVATGAAGGADPLKRVPGYTAQFATGGVFGQSVAVTPDYVGLTPEFVGLYQINVRVPANAPKGDRVTLSIAGPGGASDRVLVAIE